jgi:hypothetical protein
MKLSLSVAVAAVAFRVLSGIGAVEGLKLVRFSTFGCVVLLFVQTFSSPPGNHVDRTR